MGLETASHLSVALGTIPRLTAPRRRMRSEAPGAVARAFVCGATKS